jgi:plasmid stabilization system protein ParE
VAERVARVELTASFLERLETIESILTEADAGAAYDRLLDELRTTIIPNLRRFPRIGRRYLEQPPQSAEALAKLAAMPAGEADRLREYLHGDYLILYTVATPGRLVHLLSIRHHRELSFQFSRLWVGPTGHLEY